MKTHACKPLIRCNSFSVMLSGKLTPKRLPPLYLEKSSRKAVVRKNQITPWCQQFSS
jgi:hypothetical protein